MAYFTAPMLGRAALYAGRAARGASYAGAAYGAYGAARGAYRYAFPAPKPKKSKKKKISKKKKTDKRGLIASGDEGHTMTVGKAVIINQATREALKDSIPQVFREATTQQTTSDEGKQSHNNHNVELTYSRLSGFSTGSSTTAEKSFFLKSMERTSMFTNVTSTPVAMTIYEIEPKMDCTTDQSPEQLIQSGLKSKYNNPDQWKVPYTEITESRPFNKHYKITSQKEVVLSPGEIYKYYAKFLINKWYNSNDAITYTGGGATSETPTYVQDFTKVLYVRILGTPVTDGTLISLASSKVISTHSITIKLNIPQGISSNTTIAVNNTNFPSTLTSEKYMNEDSGDVDTVVKA